MFIFQTQTFTIYFGDKQESISLEEISAQRPTAALKSIADQIGVEQTVFLKQEHGVQGLQIHLEDYASQFFQVTGDYLVIQKEGCGIGVVTADCLPIVVYDPVTHTAAIIHAGWKGLAAGILSSFAKAMGDMQHGLVLNPENLEIYLGPAARPCCYEVQQDFVDQFTQYEQDRDEFFITKNGRIYFDSRVFIIVIARSLGIEHEKIYTRYNVCTICDQSYCSYRREKGKARRQISMICLH